MTRGLLRIALVAGVLLAWEAGVRGLGVPAYILPPPSNVFMALWRGTANGLYLNHLWVTLAETAIGFAVGSVIALFLGTVVALSRRTEYYLYPFIIMFQSMPKVALAPLFIIWFGIGLTSKVVQAAFTAFFPLMVNTIVGLRSADEDRVALMRSLDASELQIFWMLRVPSAMPFVMAGFESAGRPRHADDEHELHDGRRRAVFGPADPLRARPHPQFGDRLHPPESAVLGRVAEKRRRAGEGHRSLISSSSADRARPGRRRP
jgi:ABC-type nitrate/sulfonate/bicarbonate transport system permease component